MNGPIAWFARNHVAANLLLGVLVLGGAVSLPRMPQKSFPDIEVKLVTVSVEYLGAAPEEVEEGAHVVHLYDGSIVPAADESLAAARSGYESGTNDFLTLIAAEKTLMLSRLGWEEAMTQYHQSRARLERAIAGPLAGLEQQ